MSKTFTHLLICFPNFLVAEGCSKCNKSRKFNRQKKEEQTVRFCGVMLNLQKLHGLDIHLSECVIAHNSGPELNSTEKKYCYLNWSQYYAK